MTREEAIDIIENKIQIDVRLCTNEEVEQYIDALTMAVAALRPVSREQVVKVWRGEWEIREETLITNAQCSKCGTRFQGYYENYPFCPRCGAPMTDEAVDILLKRLEALKDGSTTD